MEKVSISRINYKSFSGLENFVVVVFVFLIPFSACTKEPAWKSLNKRIIKEHHIKEYFRDDIPETGIVSNLEPGKVTNLRNFPESEIAPGAQGRIYWGRGNLINWMILKPGAEIPPEKLPGERIMMVMKGSVQQLINGTFVSMSAYDYERMTPISGHRGKKEFVFLKKGAENAVKTGSEGAEILEVYWPVRLDYMKKAVAKNIPSGIHEGNISTAPTVKPNSVYNYYDIQFTELDHCSDSRLISGRGIQLSFKRMDPGSVFSNQNQSEEQLMIVLRGWINMTILNSEQRMETGDILYLPAGMVHGGIIGPLGCDVLDVFWPVPRDYTEKMKKRLAAYHAINPEDAKIELVVDGARDGPGLCYCEGPSWINGKLYFSSMDYDDKWNGNPGKSATVEMDPDGTYRYIATGMETNGTFLLGNGNLAVCDMYGHRVIEMTTKGEVIRILASEYNGKRLDGPNDLAVDDKGGIYFTDPQIVPTPHMQPGRSVFYRRPDGEIIRVIDPGALSKPNGLILSPDCTILYVNSTPDNFVMAYDINDDGSLSNARKFCELYVTPEILDNQSVNTQVDGMTVDELGNIYITSIIGLQIISPGGEMIGYIHFPLMPVNCCFGDGDGKTLYVNCNDKVYKIRTNVKGAAYTLKR